MFGRQNFFESDEVNHLPEQMFPFDAEMFGSQKHAEVVRHMRVDPVESAIEEQVAVREVDALLGLQRHWHLSIDIELRVIIR